MTPFEAAGYTNKTIFVARGETTSFRNGTILELKRDDGTQAPHFQVADCSPVRRCPHYTAFKHLEPIQGPGTPNNYSLQRNCTSWSDNDERVLKELLGHSTLTNEAIARYFQRLISEIKEKRAEHAQNDEPPRILILRAGAGDSRRTYPTYPTRKDANAAQDPDQQVVKVEAPKYNLTAFFCAPQGDAIEHLCNGAGRLNSGETIYFAYTSTYGKYRLIPRLESAAPSAWIVQDLDKHAPAPPQAAGQKTPARAGETWTDAEERTLVAHVGFKQPLDRIAELHERSPGAIVARLAHCIDSRPTFSASKIFYLFPPEQPDNPRPPSTMPHGSRMGVAAAYWEYWKAKLPQEEKPQRTITNITEPKGPLTYWENRETAQLAANRRTDCTAAHATDHDGNTAHFVFTRERALHVCNNLTFHYSDGSSATPRSFTIDHQEPQKEIATMNPTNKPSFAYSSVTNHFFGATNINDMTDDEAFTAVAAAEEEVKRLKKIKAKSTKLDARIAEIKDGIEAVLKIVDER